jgi:hypothetical protein
MSDLPSLGSLGYRESIAGGWDGDDDVAPGRPKKKFFGLYAGMVVNNIDPEARGRIMVNVPQVLGIMPSNWAMPCFPVAGKQMAISALPIIGDGVWVAFEDGDPGKPIWLGCFWGSVAETPPTHLAAPPITPNIVLQTIGQNSITIMGTPGGGIMLSGGPTTSMCPKIVITAGGIIITDGVGGVITIAGGTVVFSAPGAPLALVVTEFLVRWIGRSRDRADRPSADAVGRHPGERHLHRQRSLDHAHRQGRLGGEPHRLRDPGGLPPGFFS